ncbi:hypothetical protein [Nodosilinea sp. P-1105]|uniref:hypothetical protein n=1 Tax=Nodosilinea sp. P-1105 TaxID=2546229 RepID=UPI00146F12B7|nr:hypothetical protein [Nodosilinea sp. P-1105]NMF86541.1 hypothetical protein [Nodosilinea sp. P-1105]
MLLERFFSIPSSFVLVLITLGLALGCSPTSSTAGPQEAEHSAELADNQSHSHDHTDQDHTDHDHADSGEHHHGHGTLEIPAGQPVPTITLVAHPDPMRGWNLEIQTTHFRFTPEQVNQPNQPNVGHGHLYINGEKGARVYGPWLHLPQLPPGRNQITVSLNANGHEALTHNGEAIESTVVIEVPEP